MGTNNNNNNNNHGVGVGARATYKPTTTKTTTITPIPSSSLLFSVATTQRSSLLLSSTSSTITCNSAYVVVCIAAVTDTPIKPKTDTAEEEQIIILKDNETESKEKNGKDGWEIRLFNDPMNHRTFVAKCLCEICGKSDGESYQIMMQAHKNGMGVVGRYHYEIAELYYGSLKEEGLTVEMIQVDEE